MENAEELKELKARLLAVIVGYKEFTAGNAKKEVVAAAPQKEEDFGIKIEYYEENGVKKGKITISAIFVVLNEELVGGDEEYLKELENGIKQWNKKTCVVKANPPINEISEFVVSFNLVAEKVDLTKFKSPVVAAYIFTEPEKVKDAEKRLRAKIGMGRNALSTIRNAAVRDNSYDNLQPINIYTSDNLQPITEIIRNSRGEINDPMILGETRQGSDIQARKIGIQSSDGFDYEIIRPAKNADVIAHEIGHALGLDDLCAPNNNYTCEFFSELGIMKYQNATDLNPNLLPVHDEDVKLILRFATYILKLRKQNKPLSVYSPFVLVMSETEATPEQKIETTITVLEALDLNTIKK